MKRLSDRLVPWLVARQLAETEQPTQLEEEATQETPAPTTSILVEETDEEPFPLVVRREELGPPLVIVELADEPKWTPVALPFTRLDIN